ncbi:MAG: hypothetical protein N3A02_00310 [Rectinema sp.]|nr:hypothetical protein [Rectinema sp.]
MTVAHMLRSSDSFTWDALNIIVALAFLSIWYMVFIPKAVQYGWGADRAWYLVQRTAQRLEIAPRVHLLPSWALSEDDLQRLLSWSRSEQP